MALWSSQGILTLETSLRAEHIFHPPQLVPDPVYLTWQGMAVMACTVHGQNQTIVEKVQIRTNDYIIFHSSDNVITVQYIMMRNCTSWHKHSPLCGQSAWSQTRSVVHSLPGPGPVWWSRSGHWVDCGPDLWGQTRSGLGSASPDPDLGQCKYIALITTPYINFWDYQFWPDEHPLTLTPMGTYS